MIGPNQFDAIRTKTRQECEAEFARTLATRQKDHESEVVQIEKRHEDALRRLTDASDTPTKEVRCYRRYRRYRWQVMRETGTRYSTLQ